MEEKKNEKKKWREGMEEKQKNGQSRGKGGNDEGEGNEEDVGEKTVFSVGEIKKP